MTLAATNIFISYRRQDSQWPADRIHRALKQSPGRLSIFLDIDSIPLGVDFVEYLDQQVGKCDVMLVVIGPGWLEASNPSTGGRRLDDPHDFVKIEILAALRRGIPVVPILIDGTAMPTAVQLPQEISSLATRNGIEIRRTTFDGDIARLIKGLQLATSSESQSTLSLTGTEEDRNENSPDDLMRQINQIAFQLDHARRNGAPPQSTLVGQAKRLRLSGQLALLGVLTIGEVGETFDPAWHHAVDRSDDPQLPDNIVVCVHQHGFLRTTNTIKGRSELVQPAMVTVKPPSKTAERLIDRMFAEQV